mgnify:FL=1
MTNKKNVKLTKSNKKEISKSENITSKENEKDIIEIKIVEKLKKEIKEKKNELEIIDTNIYILNKITDDEYDKEKLEEEQIQIKEMLNKITSIEEQLKIYTDDKVIDDNLMLDNKDLIDEISNYKQIINNTISFKKEYSKIEEYLIIVEQIDNINDRCIELDKKKKEQLYKLNISEEEIENIEKKLVLEDENINEIEEKINESKNVINNLDDKVEEIESETKIIHNYDKLEKLISLELKYLMLMGLSPLKGAIPYIAISAKATKDAIDILRSGSLVSTSQKTEYFAKDYQDIINDSYYKLEEINTDLNSSLSSISNIKEKLNIEIIENHPKASQLLDKINRVEEMIKDNLSKVEIYKSKMNLYKEKNYKKLQKVHDLNS